ncbi:DUF1014-domain-containing protein [Daldinia sp. FL1419]|nr:DUF1014-domain-containing protein [Daldinia sp. FL1419]
MAKKGGGEGSKKAAGQARKAQAAADKVATENAKKAAAEDADWARGAKNNSKGEAQAAKKAEQAQKKAEKDALVAEEERSLPGRPGPKNSKTAVKKTNRGLDLSKLDGQEPKELGTSGIDNINELLDGVVLGGKGVKIDRNPNRRVNAAFAAFEERRLREMKEDGTSDGLNMSQRKDRIRKEFDRSPENPRYNPGNVRYNATRDEIKAAKEKEVERIEALYGKNSE